MADLKGKVAIVTGGSLGIGAAGAISLAKSGAAVAIMDINKLAGEEVVDAGHVKSLLHEARTQMRAEEPGSSGDEDAFAAGHEVWPPSGGCRRSS